MEEKPCNAFSASVSLLFPGQSHPTLAANIFQIIRKMIVTKVIITMMMVIKMIMILMMITFHQVNVGFGRPPTASQTNSLVLKFSFKNISFANIFKIKKKYIS